MPALINDRNLRLEFQDLISNLRQRGVLFYRDNAGKQRAKQAQEPVAPRPGTRR